MADGCCWKIFEMPYLACQWTDWDATWVVASHHVPNIGNAITPLTMGKSGRKRANINTKTLEVLSLLRPVVQ